MYATAFALVCVGLFFLCKMFSTGNNSDIDAAMDRIKVDIRKAENINQSVIDGLSSAERTSADITSRIERSESAIDEASNAADRIARNLKESAVLLRRSEQIIREVEERNKAEAKNP